MIIANVCKSLHNLYCLHNSLYYNIPENGICIIEIHNPEEIPHKKPAKIIYWSSRAYTIRRLVNPDIIDLEADLALIAVVGRGMKSTRGTAGRIFSALAHANINVKMIDQGSSELNIIIGVSNNDFENAIKAVYDIFVMTQI